jgi:hypothetical protein
VRSRIAVFAGAALGAAGVAYRALRRSEPAPAADPRADELRRKLDEAKPLLNERDEFEAAETPVDQAEPASVEDKRTAAHERARATVDEMRSPSEG